MRPPLEVMVRDRRQGKTTETIKWLMEPYQMRPKMGSPERVLLCINEQRADWVRREYPYARELVYSIRSWDGGLGRPRGIEIALDDADSLLYNAVGPCNLTRVTLSGISI